MISQTTDSRGTRPHTQAMKLLFIMVAVTVVVSLLYAIQYYAGGPIRLPTSVEVNDLALSPGGTLLAAAEKDGSVTVWDGGQNWARRALTGHKGPVTSAAFIPGGYTLITTGQDGTIREWNAGNGQPGRILDPKAGPLNGASLSADGSLLATIGEDGLVRIWDVASGQAIRSLGPGENTKYIVALSPDGKLVAAGDGPNIQIWDAQTGQMIRRLEGHWDDPEAKDDWLGHKKPVTALAFSPDDTILASGAADATCAFWDVDTGEVSAMAEGHYGAVTRLVFSQDGKAVISAGRDTKIRTWRLPGAKFTAVYEGHLSAVTSVAYGFRPDTLLSAGDDGMVREWETANQKVTHIEWTRYGFLSVWGKAFSVWMLLSGLLGLVCLLGLWRVKTWAHLLTLALYLLGPIVVLGLPLLEAASYPVSWGIRLQIMWPLLVLAAWYVALLIVLMREPVAQRYQASDSLPLSAWLMASRRTSTTRLGIFGTAVWIVILVVLYSILRRFNLDVAFMGHFFSFIMAGAGVTFYVSAASIALAVVLALLGALGRLSKNPIANGISSFYISLIRGTPLLVQIYIWYLGIPRVGIVLPATLAGILALGVNYGAYMSEIFRAGIQAIGKGQYEAAHALGMSSGQAFRRIVLPQAFRVVIPPIGNEFIAMMKDSALVSVMAVWELSYRAGKIGRQYFRSLETFIVAAAFYWVLTVIFQFLQGKLETYMGRSERR
jgi:polar amino acid transport system permease protein